MDFTIKERIQATEILPKQYSLDEYYIKREILSKLAFSEDEQNKLGIRISLAGIIWNEVHNPDIFDIQLTEKEIDFLKESARTLDKNKQINDLVVSFCERLLGA